MIGSTPCKASIIFPTFMYSIKSTKSAAEANSDIIKVELEDRFNFSVYGLIHRRNMIGTKNTQLIT